jgi:hypothetical protein
MSSSEPLATVGSGVIIEAVAWQDVGCSGEIFAHRSSNDHFAYFLPTSDWRFSDRRTACLSPVDSSDSF